MQQQHEAFARVWGRIADACEDGLSDPSYPAEHRSDLYELLGAARELSVAFASPPLLLSLPPA
jgi:hypothetical protein